jgi:glucose dehydrogenase
VTSLESFFFAVVALALTFGGIALVAFGYKQTGFWFVVAGGGLIACAQVIYYKLQRK